MLDAHVVKRRRDIVVDVALCAPAGAALGLFGASGAGKSTVLSCIAGAEDPDGGHVRFDGRAFFPPRAPVHRRGIGYLTQEANLFPHLTVAQNVAFGVVRALRSPGTAQWLAELRGDLHLEPVWHAPASRISGGQAHRAALARMLAPRPRLMLIDEAFAGLDRHIVRELLEALARWRSALGATAVVVDHEPVVLERLCERIVVLEAGHVVQQGTLAALRAAPATPLLKRLLDPL